MLAPWNLPSPAAGNFRPLYEETQASLLDEERLHGDYIQDPRHVK